MKSSWFIRFKKELEAVSPHVRFRRLRFGFWRIYYKEAFLGECFEEMPSRGYDIEDYDIRLSSQKYAEKWELHEEMVRRIKNFVEGYYDQTASLRRRLYLLRNNREFYETAVDTYKQVVIH